MSIPYNPSSALMSSNPMFGAQTVRRIVMSPPQSFLDSTAGQVAIAAGQAPVPQSNGPLAFGPDGQAVILAPQPAANPMYFGVNPPSSSQPGAGSGPDLDNHPNPGMPGTAMGMGVSSPDQPGINGNTQSVAQGVQAGDNQGPIVAGAAVSGSASPVATPTPTSSPGSSAVSATATSSPFRSISGSISDLSSSTSSSPPVSAAASASAAAEASGSNKPFTQSAVFIFLMVFAGLIMFGMIITALRWLFKWRGGPGSGSSSSGLFGCCGSRRKRRDLEGDDDMSDFMRSFPRPPSDRSSTSTGTGGGEWVDENGIRRNSYRSAFAASLGGMEKRMLAEDMGRAPLPFLPRSYGIGDEKTPRGSQVALDGDGMAEIDLNEDGPLGLPHMPAATALGSPQMDEGMFGTRKLEVRNKSVLALGDEAGGVGGYGDKAKTLPRSWAADRGLGNVEWHRSKSNSSLPSTNDTLISPFSVTGHDDPDRPVDALTSFANSLARQNSGIDPTWARSISQATTHISAAHAAAPPALEGGEAHRTSSWASNLRSSLLAAISTNKASAGPNTAPLPHEDKFTRAILPTHLSRSSTHRSGRSLATTISRASTTRSSTSSQGTRVGPLSDTFGRSTGRGLGLGKGLVVVDVDEADLHDGEADDGKDDCSLASSARRDIEAVLRGMDGMPEDSYPAVTGGVAPLRIGSRLPLNAADRWKRLNRSSGAVGASGLANDSMA